MHRDRIEHDLDRDQRGDDEQEDAGRCADDQLSAFRALTCASVRQA
jgi:hypothetical protein